MQINKLAYVLLPIIALSPPSEVSDWGEVDNNNNGIIVGRGETTTSPGGFSTVTEPAGPLTHSRPIRMTPGQRHSRYQRNIQPVQPLHC